MSFYFQNVQITVQTVRPLEKLLFVKLVTTDTMPPQTQDRVQVSRNVNSFFIRIFLDKILGCSDYKYIDEYSYLEYIITAMHGIAFKT